MERILNKSIRGETRDGRVNVVPVETLIPEIRPELKSKGNVRPFPGSKFFCGYIDHLYNQIKWNPEMIGSLNFKDQIVVDLGAGMSNLGYDIASFSEAKGYVAVDPFYAMWQKENLQRTTKESLEKRAKKIKLKSKLIPAAVSQNDLHGFLKRLPNDSVSVIAAGIDKMIIRDPNYLKAAAFEIERVLHPKGSYVNVSSDILPITLEENGLLGSDSIMDSFIRRYTKRPVSSPN